MKTQYWHTANPFSKFNWFGVMTKRLILVALLCSTHASANPIIQYWQNRTGSGPGFSFQPKISYFNTSQNFNSVSMTEGLLNGSTVNRTYFELNGSYGFNENFFVFARLSALYTSINGLGTSNLNTTDFGLNDQLVGAAWRAVHLENGTSINLQAETTIPAYSNDNSKINGTPWMGDGSYDMTFGGFAEVPLFTDSSSQYYLDAGAGYTYRSYGFSASVPWNIQIKRYPNKEGLLFSAGARGNQSLQTETLTEGISRADSNAGASGSFLISGYNPSWILGQASIGYQDKNNIQYVFAGAYPFRGTNIPDGFQISFGVQFDIAPSPQSTTKTKKASLKKGKFVEYDLTAKVTSVNDQLYLLKIDRGLDDGIKVGQIFDIMDEQSVIAKAKVTQVKNDESALNVIEYLKETTIEIDAKAKRVAEDQ